MTSRRRSVILAMMTLAIVCCLPQSGTAQRRPYRMTDRQIAQVVPAAFYFQGQTALTQMRNSSAIRFGEDRHVIAGLVDTSGYAADVRAKYEGFLIVDLPITINGQELGVGAYGFGFSNDGKLNIMNIAGEQLLSVNTTKDNALRRPRPLMLVEAGNEVRFYSGKDYALIAAK
ncbi:MAG TPA: hypothetical protein VJS64_14730 [Pyrinomonadaceae bacterium]|nr:hypothetical protein [Pyrinomonadaceae bacterium]